MEIETRPDPPSPVSSARSPSDRSQMPSPPPPSTATKQNDTSVTHIPLVDAYYTYPPKPGEQLHFEEDLRTSPGTKQFRRKRGPPTLEPLRGRLVPGKVEYCIDWDVRTGDLQDVRNRMGLLCPPCARFVEFELGYPLVYKQRPDAIDYMHKVYNERAFRDRPYFICKDTPTGRVLLVSNTATPIPELKDPMGGKSMMASGGSKPRRLSARLQRLQEAMVEASTRREEERQEDSKIWKSKVSEDVSSSSSSTSAKAPTTRKKLNQVKPRVYLPRVVRPKSEWTVNLETEMAKARKRDIHGFHMRRLEIHGMHGDIVRSVRQFLYHQHTEGETFSSGERSLAETPDVSLFQMKWEG